MEPSSRRRDVKLLGDLPEAIALQGSRFAVARVIGAHQSFLPSFAREDPPMHPQSRVLVTLFARWPSRHDGAIKRNLDRSYFAVIRTHFDHPKTPIVVGAPCNEPQSVPCL
jgi:hypothetical protein